MLFPCTFNFTCHRWKSFAFFFFFSCAAHANVHWQSCCGEAGGPGRGTTGLFSLQGWGGSSGLGSVRSPVLLERSALPYVRELKAAGSNSTLRINTQEPAYYMPSKHFHLPSSSWAFCASIFKAFSETERKKHNSLGRQLSFSCKDLGSQGFQRKTKYCHTCSAVVAPCNICLIASSAASSKFRETGGC